MELIVPTWLDVADNFADKIGALTTMRSGGVSVAPYGAEALNRADGGLNLGLHVGDNPAHVAHNRRKLQTLLPSAPLWLTQVHGIDVVEATQADQGQIEADASFTTERNTVCAIQTADCLPVLFCDSNARVVAAAHAGWRGLAHGVLEQTVARMRAAGANDILAWLGPAIGPQHFEVGADVLDAFVQVSVQNASAFQARDGQPGKYLADIYQLARNALQRVSVTRVSGGEYCTVADPRFYSYRRDRITGRMASLIWRK